MKQAYVMSREAHSCQSTYQDMIDQIDNEELPAVLKEDGATYTKETYEYKNTHTHLWTESH